MNTTATPTRPPDLDDGRGGPPTRRTKRRRRLLATIAAVVLVIGLAVGGVLYFFRGDAPDAVNLADASASISSVAIDDATSTAATAATTATAAADTAAATSVEGTWDVDTSVGEFSYEDSTGTFVGFRVDEELTGIGSTTAVGRTPDVSGAVTIEGTTLTAATIEADMTSITTNDTRRDDNALAALDVATYPTATFVLTEPVDLGDAATTGEAVTVDATGELTIHGVTTTVTIPLQAQLVDDTIVVVGSLDVTFSDYGVSVPSAPIVVSAEDTGTIELQLFLST